MAQHDVDALGHQLGGRIGGHFRFANVVFHQQLYLLAEDAALGIDILDHQFGGFDGRYAVRCQVPAVRTATPSLMVSAAMPAPGMIMATNSPATSAINSFPPEFFMILSLHAVVVFKYHFPKRVLIYYQDVFQSSLNSACQPAKKILPLRPDVDMKGCTFGGAWKQASIAGRRAVCPARCVPDVIIGILSCQKPYETRSPFVMTANDGNGSRREKNRTGRKNRCQSRQQSGRAGTMADRPGCRRFAQRQSPAGTELVGIMPRTGTGRSFCGFRARR